MQVQVLYFEGCPNYKRTVQLARDVIRDLGLHVAVEEVEVSSIEDAERLRFLGSPTVLVNSVDIEPSARSSTAYAFACRTYAGAGTPPRELLIEALTATDDVAASHASSLSTVTAPEQTPGRVGFWLGAAGLSAVVASVCCIGPLVLATLGLSAVGFSSLFATFEQIRPFFLGGAALLLAGGFYLTYFRKLACAPGAVCAVPNAKLQRLNRSMLWVATVLVVAVGLFPTYAGSLLRATSPPVATANNGNGTTIGLHINGMTCEACAVSIEQALAAIPGVHTASVNFKNAQAQVSVDATAPPSTQTLIHAVEQAGYTARPINGKH